MSTNQLLTRQERLARFLEESSDFRSASAIAAFGEEEFKTYYTNPDHYFGDEDEALHVFARAEVVSGRTALVWANIKDAVASPYIANTLFNNIPQSFIDKQQSLPNYAKLFKAVKLHDCEHCKSIFGPAAYFVDLMRFIEEKINPRQTDAQLKLENRQPSLVHIDLDCDNTYKLLPFIDIVNEILEAVVRDPQTPDAFEKAAAATYPMDLPFNLPHAEVRAYLEAMGTQLDKVYDAFNLIANPVGQAAGPLSPQDQIGRESLGLSPLEYQLLETTEANDEQLLRYFGTELSDYADLDAALEALADVETFLEQTDLSRKQLMKLVYQDLDEGEIRAGLSRFFFINNVGDRLPPLSIIIDDSDPNNLLERFRYLSRQKLDAIRRFLLLARKLEWTYADLDWALRSVQEGKPTERVLKFDGINDYVACKVKRGLSLSDVKKNISIEAWVQPEGEGNRVILCSGKAIDNMANLILMIDYAGRLCLLNPKRSENESTEENILIHGEQTLLPGALSHVAVVLNRNTEEVLFYINGQLDVIKPIDNQFSLQSRLFDTNIFIGGNFNDRYFAGVITELRIWNGIRSAEDIDSHRFSRLVGDEARLLGYWPLQPTPWNNLPDLVNRNDGMPGGYKFVTQPRWVERDLLLDPPPGGVSPLAPPTYEAGLIDLDENFWQEDRLGLADFTTQDTVRSHPLLGRNTTTLDKRTVQVWFKAEDTHLGHQVIYQEGEHEGGLIIYLHEGFLYFGAYTDSDTDPPIWEQTFLKTSQVYAGQWHHAAIVLDASPTLEPEALQAYLDGRLVDTGPASQIEQYNGKVELGGVNNAARFHDGKYQAIESSGFTPNAFKGVILEFQLWETAISGNVIRGKRFSTSLTGTESDLLLWSGNWPSDQLTDRTKLVEIQAPVPLRAPMELNRQALRRLSHIKQLRTKTKLDIDRLCALWFSLKHSGKADSATLFDTVFNALRRGQEYWGYFADQPICWDRSGQRNPKQDRLTRSRLMGSLRLSQKDLDALMDWLVGTSPTTSLSTDRLHEMYRLSQLAKVLRMKMADFLALLDIMGIDKIQSIEHIVEIAARADWLKLTGLRVYELDYLIHDVPNSRIKVIWSEAELRGVADDLLKQATEFLATEQSFLLDDIDLSRSGDLIGKLAESGFLTPNVALGTEEGIAMYVVEDSVLDIPALETVLLGFDWLQDDDDDKRYPLRKAISELLIRKNAAHFNACIEGLAGLFNAESELVSILFSYYRDEVSPTDFLNQMSALDESLPVPFAITDYLEGYEKILFVTDKFALVGRELDALLDHPEWFGLVNLVSPGISEIDHLFNFKALTTKFRDNEDHLIGILAASVDEIPLAGERTLLQELADLTAWDENQLDRLIAALGFDDNYNTIPHLSVLNQCFELANDLEADMSLLISLADTRQLDYAFYRNHADALLNLFQAQFDDPEAWNKAFRPVWNQLAEQQRNALTSLAMLKVPDDFTGRRSPDLLSEFLLIDVQMGSEVDTSRIKQAILSAQLYVQRYLMNLEANISPDIPLAEWDWMKNYRVWEANRKVFLYPENYIEPELRDNKTPLFKALEDQLMQGEINEITATQALSKYLNSFAELANLKIVGSYWHKEINGDDTLYLVGRTEAEPHQYYHRKKVNGQKWFPWQKIDLSIPSNFVNPVFAFGRLYLFWAEIEKAVEAREVEKPSSESDEDAPNSLFKISEGWFDSAKQPGISHSLFEIKQGLVGTDGFSFESVAETGYFFEITNGYVNLKNNGHSDYSNQDATWHLEVGSNGGWLLYNDPGNRYLYATNANELKVKVIDVNNGGSLTSNEEWKLEFIDENGKVISIDGADGSDVDTFKDALNDKITSGQLKVRFHLANDYGKIITRNIDAPYDLEIADDDNIRRFSFESLKEDDFFIEHTSHKVNLKQPGADSWFYSDATWWLEEGLNGSPGGWSFYSWHNGEKAYIYPTDSNKIKIEKSLDNPELRNKTTWVLEIIDHAGEKIDVDGLGITTAADFATELKNRLKTGQFLRIRFRKYVDKEKVISYTADEELVINEYKKNKETKSFTVLKPSIKYSYLDLNNAWVPTQTFETLDSITPFETQLLRWQRVYVLQTKKLIDDKERILIFYGNIIRSLRNGLKENRFKFTFNANPHESYNLIIHGKQLLLNPASTGGLLGYRTVTDDFLSFARDVAVGNKDELETWTDANGPVQFLLGEEAHLQLSRYKVYPETDDKDWSNEDLILLDAAKDFAVIDDDNEAIFKTIPGGTEARVFRVTNQQDWHIFDVGEEQFLIRKQQGSYYSVDEGASGLGLSSTSGGLPAEEDEIYDEQYDLNITNSSPTSVTNILFELERLSTNLLPELSAKLFIEGVAGLLSTGSQDLDELDFLTRFDPDTNLIDGLGDIKAKLDFEGAMGLYYREFFFHIPFHIANHLNANQKFAEAQKWYHYIFDPTTQESDDSTQPNPNDRYWRYLPFRNQSMQSFEEMLTNPDALAEYHNDPFDPHAIARLRINAYQKAIVMKYIDNLLDWGDSLFRQDTRESINEATLLYILAYNILGPRPKPLIQEKRVVTGTYASIREERQSTIPEFLTPEGGGAPISPNHQLEFSFCIPENENFVAYWGRVEDRLFKVRHSLNIDGVFRKLALFEPPIDPMALVRAVAGGRALGSVLSGQNAPVSHYRYPYLLDKARNLVGTVQGLGDALLSAIEKKDAEALAVLQNTQERAILDLTTSIKKNELEAAMANLRGLRTTLEGAKRDKAHYNDLIEDYDDDEGQERDYEIAALSLDATASSMKTIASGMLLYGSVYAQIPEVTIGVLAGVTGGPISVVTKGGNSAASTATNWGEGFRFLAESISLAADGVNTQAGYRRRRQEWEFQKERAQTEIEYLEDQITAAEMAVQSAAEDIRIHQQNLDNNKQIQDFMRTKFSNESLYNWMVSRISGLYFQTYKLAFDMAKMAEKALQYEFGINDTYINFGHWDSLKKGLLAGESLELDLNRMEKAAIDMDSRYLEIEKVISLRQLEPEALFQLKDTGKCTFKFTERLFDHDYPGHYFRVIKSLSITVPAVVGPYQTVKATLTQTNSKTLLSPDTAALDFLYEESTEPTNSVRVNWRPYQSIAISKGINDSGLFELNFNDDRYLPFEGTGAISEWELSMPKATNPFDFDTLTDVIINLKYTAAHDSGLRTAVVERLQPESTEGWIVVSLAQENPAAWNQFVQSESPHQLNLTIASQVFPANLTGRVATQVGLLAESSNELNIAVDLMVDDDPVPVSTFALETSSSLVMSEEGIRINLEEQPVLSIVSDSLEGLENLILVLKFSGDLPWDMF